jgi:hypothetical protein
MRGVFAALWTCAVLFFSGGARADEPPKRDTQTYALSFVRGSGAETCPNRQDLEREVSTKLGHSPFDAGATRSIEILVEATPEGYRSVVSAIDRDGKVLGRRVLLGEEESCAPIFSATALAVALLIDPEAALNRDSHANEAVGRFEVEEPPRPPPAPPPTPVAPPPAVPPALAPPIYAEPETQIKRYPVSFTGADAVVAIGLVPSVSPGVGFFADVRVSRPWGFALSALYVTSGSTPEGNGAVLDVSLTSFGLALSLAAVTTPSFRVLPDIGLAAGALHVGVRNGQAIGASDQPYFALAFGVRLEAQVINQLFLTLRAGGAVPLIRRGLFVQGTTEPLWRQPPIGGVASFGVAWGFF